MSGNIRRSKTYNSPQGCANEVPCFTLDSPTGIAPPSRSSSLIARPSDIVVVTGNQTHRDRQNSESPPSPIIQYQALRHRPSERRRSSSRRLSSTPIAGESPHNTSSLPSSSDCEALTNRLQSALRIQNVSPTPQSKFHPAIAKGRVLSIGSFKGKGKKSAGTDVIMCGDPRSHGTGSLGSFTTRTNDRSLDKPLAPPLRTVALPWHSSDDSYHSHSALSTSSSDVIMCDESSTQWTASFGSPSSRVHSRGEALVESPVHSRNRSDAPNPPYTSVSPSSSSQSYRPTAPPKLQRQRRFLLLPDEDEENEVLMSENSSASNSVAASTTSAQVKGNDNQRRKRRLSLDSSPGSPTAGYDTYQPRATAHSSPTPASASAYSARLAKRPSLREALVSRSRESLVSRRGRSEILSNLCV